MSLVKLLEQVLHCIGAGVESAHDLIQEVAERRESHSFPRSKGRVLSAI